MKLNFVVERVLCVGKHPCTVRIVFLRVFFFLLLCCLCVAEPQCHCATHSIYKAGLHACPSQCSVILCTMFVGVLACVAYFQGKSLTWLVVSRSYIAFSSTGRDMNTRNQLSFRTFCQNQPVFKTIS